MGFLIEKELKYLGEALNNPKRPFLAILGGAKVADKIAVIESLITKVDTLLIGGGMAYTFLKAKGCPIGKSILDKDGIEYAGSLLKRAEETGIQLYITVDVLAGEAFNNDTPWALYEASPSGGIPEDREGLDIGPKTTEIFEREIAKAGTILWNGPVGAFELPNFAGGTKAVAAAIVKATDNGAVTIVGGGDSAAAVAQLGFADRMSHVSTGGGASLEFIEGRKLPGVEVLNDKEDKQ